MGICFIDGTVLLFSCISTLNNINMLDSNTCYALVYKDLMFNNPIKSHYEFVPFTRTFLTVAPQMCCFLFKMLPFRHWNQICLCAKTKDEVVESLLLSTSAQSQRRETGFRLGALTWSGGEPAPPQSRFWGTDPRQPCSPPEPGTGRTASSCRGRTNKTKMLKHFLITLINNLRTLY